MTGAGISTTAGIPDFRSSDNGLFKMMQEKYKLSTPEEFFHISTFETTPQLFYDFAKEFELDKYQPTPTHWFQSFLVHKGLVNLIITRNIDALELKAKIPREKIIFAHGNMLEAHCYKCLKDYDIGLQQTHIKEGKVLYCTEENCDMAVKPKVVFYGESLPKDFYERYEAFEESDLGFIMGTSLKVYPFAMLPYDMTKSSWRIVINREQIGDSVKNNSRGFDYENVAKGDIFLEGTTDDFVLKIINDCGWKAEFDKYVEEKKLE